MYIAFFVIIIHNHHQGQKNPETQHPRNSFMLLCFTILTCKFVNMNTIVQFCFFSDFNKQNHIVCTFLIGFFYSQLLFFNCLFNNKSGSKQFRSSQRQGLSHFLVVFLALCGCRGTPIAPDLMFSHNPTPREEAESNDNIACSFYSFPYQI